MFSKKIEKMISEAFDKRAENIDRDIPEIEFSEAYSERKRNILSRNRKEGRTVMITFRHAASVAAVICTVVLCTAVAAGVIANISQEKKNTFEAKMQEKYDDSPVYTETPSGTLQKVTVMLGEEKIELEYDRSSTEINGVVVNEYKDSNGSAYTLDQNGNVIMYNAGTAESYGSEGGKVLSEKQIHDLALKKYSEVYPEFAKDSVLIDCNCNKVSDRFYLTFGKLYGEGDFVVGESFKAIVKNNGFIDAWGMRKLDTMQDFDVNLLNGLDKKTVEEYALKTVYAKYPDSDNNYSVGGIYMAKVDESYALEILVEYDDGTETVYYELN